MEFGRFSGRSGAKYGANANYQLGEEERKLLRRAKLGTNEMVGVGRIELPTSCSQSRRPTAGLHPVVSEFTMSIDVESLRPEWARAYLDPSPGPTSEG